MTKKEYNGWFNYETWLDNDQGSSEYWSEQARAAFDYTQPSPPSTRHEQATLEFMRQLEAEIKDANPLADHANLFVDLLNAALSEVNWHEIARHYIDRIDEEETEIA